jgi:hypothetical protein
MKAGREKARKNNAVKGKVSLNKWGLFSKPLP